MGEQPKPGERVHLRHAALGGALCRMLEYPAPWVTNEVDLVTCPTCRAQLAKPVFGEVRSLTPPFARDAEPLPIRKAPESATLLGEGSGVYDITFGPARVHAAARRASGDGPLCRCPAPGITYELSTNPQAVTCWACQKRLRQQRREVSHG